MEGTPEWGRAGFTVVEVLLALLLLSFMVMGFQAATGEIIHYAAQSDRQVVAVQLVEDRLDMIHMDTEYSTLQARYAEVQTVLPACPTMRRTTRVVRTRASHATGLLDYTTITVTIDSGSLREPVSRTIVVAAP